MEALEKKLFAEIQSLPRELQLQLLKHIEKLKARTDSSSEKIRKPLNPDKKEHPKFKPGFGGAKGFFILKEGWDEPLTEDFKDYM